MGGSGLSSGDYRADEARLSKLVGRVKSRPFLERVVKILRMEEDPTVRAQAAELQKNYPEQSIDELAVRILVRRLGGRIQFGSAGPGIFRIIVSDYSPENAQLLAKWISELFVDVTIQTALDQIRSAREFGAEQLHIYEEELTRSEEALERHKGSLIEENFAQNVVRAGNLMAAEALLRRMKEEAATLESLAKPISRAATQAGLTGTEGRITEGSDIREPTERLYASLEKAVRDRLAVEAAVDPLAWPPQGRVENLWRQLYRALEIQVESL